MRETMIAVCGIDCTDCHLLRASHGGNARGGSSRMREQPGFWNEARIAWVVNSLTR